MITLLLHLLRLLPVLWGGHRQVALENLALRHQLAVYKKTVNRPKLRSSDRLFWVALSRAWAALEKDAPDARPIARPAFGRIVEINEVGGLHHRYERQAA